MYRKRFASISDMFIPGVISRIECLKHSARFGDPCFTVRTAKGNMPAVCNHRATLAGFSGRISPNSLSLSQRKK
jgi:hypothetical protein